MTATSALHRPRPPRLHGMQTVTHRGTRPRRNSRSAPRTMSAWPSMRVAITGGRSNRQLSPARLAELGHEVRGIDLVRPDAPWADRAWSSPISVHRRRPSATCSLEPTPSCISPPSPARATSPRPRQPRAPDASGARWRPTPTLAGWSTPSSNHAVGFTPRRPRPDRRAAPAGHVVRLRQGRCRGAVQLVHDRHGLAVACLRIGAFRPAPPLAAVHRCGCRRGTPFASSTPTCKRLISGFAVVYGISDNRRAWWDLEPGRAIGYHPVDDARRAADIEGGDTGDRGRRVRRSVRRRRVRPLSGAACAGATVGGSGSTT